jgi:dihydropteroate synthase
MTRDYIIPVASGRSLVLGPRTLVMGILNVTPDSFADGGLYVDPERAVEAGLAMVAAGVDIIDVGGESTRPGAGAVSADEEQRRVLPVIRALAGQVAVPISVDTSKASVARAAVDAGAGIINDVSGLAYDPGLAAVAAASGAGLVLMHMRGHPADMYAHAHYDNLASEVASELRASMDIAIRAGVRLESIILDPGVGFAKRPEHSFGVIARLDDPAFAALDRPWLVGPSRKSYLKSVLGDLAPDDLALNNRDWGTAAAVTASVLMGAHIVRVHAVKEMVQVVRVADKIRALRGASPPA